MGKKPDPKTLQHDITEAIADCRAFQKEHGSSFPITVQIIEVLIKDLQIAVDKQNLNGMLEGCQALKDIISEPKPREHVSGKVQIVEAPSWEEAAKQCPWAARLQPAGMLKHQEGKWICFETDDDADVYRNLQNY